MSFATYRPFNRRERLNRWLKSKFRSSDLSGDGDMSDCAYYRNMGTCSFGCREEPACMTDMPIDGWPLDRPWFVRTQRWFLDLWTRITCKHTLSTGKSAFRPVLTFGSREARYYECVFCRKRRPV